MSSESERGRPATRRLKGCLITLLLVGGCLAFSMYQAFEPDRHASRVHQSIHLGMSLGEVEGLIAGVKFHSYKMKRGADWEYVSRDEFLAASGASPRMISLHFLSPPRRLGFNVEFDERGLVSGITSLKVELD